MRLSWGTPAPSFGGEPSQSRKITDGGAKGSRTLDLLNAIQALYQLSYRPSLYKEEGEK